MILLVLRVIVLSMRLSMLLMRIFMVSYTLSSRMVATKIQKISEPTTNGEHIHPQHWQRKRHNNEFSEYVAISFHLPVKMRFKFLINMTFVMFIRNYWFILLIE